MQNPLLDFYCVLSPNYLEKHYGQVKFHREKCCSYFYKLVVISEVWRLNTLNANISGNY